MARELQVGPNGVSIIRLLMLGDSGAGKSSLVLRFDTNLFTPKYVSTIGVDYKDRTVTIDADPVRLQLWDTAGQERFRSLTSNFFSRADGFVVTYAVSSRSSFLSVARWISDINARAPPDMEVVLCGNKGDLEEGERRVSREEGEEMAREMGVAFAEVR